MYGMIPPRGLRGVRGLVLMERVVGFLTSFPAICWTILAPVCFPGPGVSCSGMPRERMGGVA